MNTEIYESLPTSSTGMHMTAGALAGIMEHCILFPIDSVKTRMQSLTPGPGGGGGITGILSAMIRQEGLFRPIRGMSATIAGAGPAHALYFSCYEYLKSKFIKNSRAPDLNCYICGLAGAMATVLHDGVMNPAEVVKQRLQMYNSPYQSVLTCAGHIYRKEGIRAFYRSYMTQLVMNVPFHGIHVGAYEYAQNVTNPAKVYNPIAHVVSGAAAGAVAAAATTPFDVCKTLLNTTQAKGIRDAIVKVYRFWGVLGYFRGLNARVVYQMPATAVCWTTYESFKYILRTWYGEHSGPEPDDDSSGMNQNQTAASSRSNCFQHVGLYKNASAPVLLEVTSS